VAGGSCERALAQASTPPCDYSENFCGLAKLITTSFPISGNIAYTDNGWCYQIETDPTENFWYFKYNGKVYGASSEYGKRIRLIFKDLNGNFSNFASIFLGVDLLKPGDYPKPADYSGILQSLLTSIQIQNIDQIQKGVSTKTSHTPTDPDNVIFPTVSPGPNPTNSCPKLNEVLPMTFPAWSNQSWSPAANPLCNEDASKTPHCQTFNVQGYDVPETQTSQTDIPLYWRFNNRTHTLSGAVRAIIQWTDATGKTVYGYLMIGYGGSGGAA